MDLNTRTFSRSVCSRSKNIGIDPVPLSQKTIQRIEEAKKDIKDGNVCTLKELKAELGLE
ncbi:hypothetical protein [Methanolobus bombayensis]|jgi:hypothetical protein|uniref:hypothetical protein n=1 Tax=Methanolobus bombayensis TaxID=38023 RepID=UPI001AEAD02B|nr:hypothetical protein [Methanolobus bombayensis]MBP1910649.1 hypothetical protein [Methanolobus bombayensis]